MDIYDDEEGCTDGFDRHDHLELDETEQDEMDNDF